MPQTTNKSSKNVDAEEAKDGCVFWLAFIIIGAIVAFVGYLIDPYSDGGGASLIITAVLSIVAFVAYIKARAKRKAKQRQIEKELRDKKESKMQKIEKEIRKEILAPFYDRYNTAEQMKEHISDLQNLIKHKTKYSFKDDDIIYLISLYEKNRNFEVIDENISRIGSKTMEDFVDLYIAMLSREDFENSYSGNMYSGNMALFAEYFRRNNLNFDMNSFREAVARKIEEKKAEEFERKLMRGKSIDVDDIDALSGVEFEEAVADLFRKTGYSVKLTPKTGDQGADLIVEKDGITTAIQTKRYTGNVGNKAIQEVVAAKKFYDCDETMVITTSTFTKGAIELAAKNNVTLVDGQEIKKMFDDYL